MEEFVRDLIILRPRDSFRWLIDGYKNPRENIKIAQYQSSKVYYYEDIIENMPSGDLCVLAYNDIEIIRAGQDFWDTVRTAEIPVDTGKSNYLKTLISAICQGYTASEDRSALHVEMGNLLEFTEFENYRILINPNQAAVDRASLIFDKTILFGGAMDLRYPDNVIPIPSKGYIRFKNSGIFVGTFKQFGDFIKDISDISKGIKKIEAHIIVNAERNEVEYTKEKFLNMLDDVKDSLKLELNFSCDAVDVDVTQLLGFKLHGVKPIIPDTFKKKTRDLVKKTISQKRLDNKKPMKTVREFYA